MGIVLLVAIGSAAPAEAASGKRPRVVVRVAPFVQALPHGTLAGARFTLHNRTGARRAATRARVALVLRPGKVVRLATTRVPALKAGRSVQLSAAGRVPARVAAGAYAVRVCVVSPGRDACRRSVRRSVTVGQALAPARLSLDKATVDLGDVVVGHASTNQVIVVTNHGDVPVQDLQIAVGGPQADEITSTSTCAGVLAPASSCSITVQLIPTARGARSADLTVTGSSGQAVSASLTGTGLASSTLSVESALLPSTLLGQVSPTRDLTVTNTGDVPSGPISTRLSSLDADQFAIVGSTCGAALAPAATCTLTVRFAPTQRGYQSTYVVVTDDEGTEGRGGLGGEGLAPAQLSISPLDTVFPVTTNGEVSEPVTVTVTNVGDVPTQRLLTTSFSANSSRIHFRNLGDNCTFAVGPGDSCRVIVAFAPTLSATAGTPYTVTLSVGGAPTGTPVASFSGTSRMRAWMTVTPSGGSFGNVVVGQQSAAQQFTFTNSGDVPSPAQTAGLIGTDPGQYAVTGNTCDTPVDPGGSCTVSVTFNPTSIGPKRARVVIVRPDGRIDTVGASLLGTGLAPLTP